MKNKIVLVGPMGAGKTTIGRLLAKTLQLPFKDTDSVIEQSCGADIPWIFDIEGEAGFRKRETSALKDCLGEKQIVLATGGGIVVTEENRELLNDSTDAVIYLSAKPEHLARRTAKDKNRPLLQVDDPQQKIVDLLEEREPLYLEVATHVVLTERQSPKYVATDIARRLGHKTDPV